MKICLITNAHVSYNPRILKEADVLCGAGHEVRVVAIDNHPELACDDEKILASRRWKCVRINFEKSHKKGRVRWAISGLRQKFFYGVSGIDLRLGIAEKAFCRYFSETLKEALKEPADFYIAHNLQALPVAAQAARKNKGLLGFDMEDFHVSEDSYLTQDHALQRLKDYLINKYISACDYVSCTSEVMADALVESLGIKRPVVLYNVFPLCYRDGLLSPDQRSQRNESYSAYWFSHVVGLDRGLQDFIKAMSLFKKRIDLYLRGRIHENAKEELCNLGNSLNVAGCIHFLPPIYAEDLVRDAASYDFGLALEQPVSRNRLLTVTNKIFTYLLAGLVIVVTDTPGQREIMEEAQGAGVVYKPGDYVGLANQVNALIEEDKLVTMKRRSWKLAEEKFNWDMEKDRLLQVIDEINHKVK